MKICSIYIYLIKYFAQNISFLHFQNICQGSCQKKFFLSFSKIFTGGCEQLGLASVLQCERQHSNVFAVGDQSNRVACDYSLLPTGVRHGDIEHMQGIVVGYCNCRVLLLGTAVAIFKSKQLKFDRNHLKNITQQVHRIPKYSKIIKLVYRVPKYPNTIKLVYRIPKYSNTIRLVYRIPEYFKTIKLVYRIPKYFG